MKVRSVSDTFATKNAGQSLEELVEIQALSVDLREAVMACLCGGESRRWTIAELVERFKNLGVCASRASVTAALAELALELEISGWAPWRLLERGTEWILEPKSELVALLSGVRRLPVKELSKRERYRLPAQRSALASRNRRPKLFITCNRQVI